MNKVDRESFRSLGRYISLMGSLGSVDIRYNNLNLKFELRHEWLGFIMW